VQFSNRRSIFKNIVSGICGYCSRMGLGDIDLRDLMKLFYAAQFVFYARDPNWPHVSK
jgi:hypothetical protein